MYVWRMGAYVWFGDTRLFFLLLLAAWSRDCALRVRLCDEAVFLSFFPWRCIYLSILSIWTEEWAVGCTCVCRQKVMVGPQQVSGNTGWLRGEGGGGSGRRKGLENKKIGLS